MSKPRTFLSFASVCSAALVAARLAVWMFPMQTPAQTTVSAQRASIVADGPGVVVEPGAKLLHRSPVFYPSGVTTVGTVVIESSVNAKGEVTDAHVVSGPDEFRNAALSSVLNWHFSPGGLPPVVQSVIRFETAGRTESAPATVTATPPVVATRPSLKEINMSGLSDELAEKVRAGLPVHIGDSFGTDQSRQVRAAIKEVDEHLMYGIRMDQGDVILTIMLRPTGVVGGVSSGVIGGVPVGVLGGIAGGIVQQIPVITDAGPTAAAAAQFAPPANGMMRVRVGGNVQAANLTRKVTPAYPPLAKQARISGTVRFTALIGTDGSILALQLVSGHPLLVESAQDAVKQWMYKPTLLNGNPVEVITQIDVNYTLSH